MHREEVKASHLIEVICDCWQAAERNVQSFVKTEARGVGEEFITQYFFIRLRTSVTEASESGKIEQAFRQDIEDEIRMASTKFDVASFVSGIRATITMHPRHIESQSGGDFGLVLVIPNRITDSGPSIQFRSQHRGLLCQAKLGKLQKNAKTVWGGFSPNQKSILSGRLDYLALLLYKYSDLERRHLDDFVWQLCAGYPFGRVSEWPSKGSFPSLKSSSEIIKLLAEGSAGISDERVIQDYIEPAVDYYYRIDIGWPDDPYNGMRVLTRVSQEVDEIITVKLSY
jgi:hypothetical protein